LDFRVLEYFIVVAKEANITKAAALLHVTQPTLSRQLKQLEEELQVSLFTRSNHHIRLTEEGLLFLRRAKEMLELNQRAKRELLQTEELIGEIDLGCGELTSMAELATWITEFQQLFPQVKFNFHSGNNDNILAWLEQGMIDLGLFIEPVDISKYTSIRMKQTENWGVLAHKNSPFATYDAIRPGDLVGTKVITNSDKVVQHELVVWSGKFASEMECAVQYNLLYNAAVMASANQGVVISLELAQEFSELIFVPLDPPLVLHSALAWHETKPNSRVTAAFIDFVQSKRNSKNV
jgi:DNA-binding transcriptional LysR family regulator